MTQQPTNNARTVYRRKARSGLVSYGDPVVLRDNSQSRIQFVPFFVPRSKGTDLGIKVVSYRKNPPPQDWALIEDKSLSLEEPEARLLLSALRDHFAVAEDSQDGQHIAIRIDEGTATLGNSDPAAVAAALAKVLSQQEIVKHLAETDLSDSLVSAFRSAIRLKEMRSAVAKLRNLLDSGESAEQFYQQWCKEHSWAFGNAYVMTDEVRDISASDSVDLLLPNVISGYRDIVELKRPDPEILFYDKDHRNYFFSSDVSRALGQVHRYLDILHEFARNGLQDHPEIVAYHPRATIVIGRWMVGSPRSARRFTDSIPASQG